MTDLEHSRDCPSLWGADMPCDCDAAAWTKLEKRIAKLEVVAEAAKRLCKSWDINRDGIYKLCGDLNLSVLDPRHRYPQCLGLDEALKALEAE